MPTLTPQITVTATLGSIGGTNTAGSSLQVTLCGFTVPPAVIGGPSFEEISQNFPFPPSGPLTFLLFGNDVISPTGTFYCIQGIDPNGNVVSAQNFRFVGAGTVDLSVMPPYDPTGGLATAGLIYLINVNNVGPAGPAGTDGGTYQIPLTLAAGQSMVVDHLLGTEVPGVWCWQTGTGGSFIATMLDLNRTTITAITAITGTFVFQGGILAQIAPVITINPTSQTVTNGAPASLVSGATGSPFPACQWYSDFGTGGATWTAITGAVSPTYNFTGETAQTGWQYKATYTNANGSATTTIATITVSSLTAGLTNYWTMNEGSGLTFIDSIGGVNFTIPGGSVTWSGGIATFALGTNNSAAYAGSSPATINTGTSPWSISMWFNPAASQTHGGQATIFSNSQVSTPGIEILMDGSGNMAIVLINNAGGSNLIYKHIAGAPTASVRKNYIYTYDGTQTAAGLKMYVNGVLQTMTTDTDSLSASIAPSLPLNFMGTPTGSGNNSGNCAAGALDHTRIYNRALSASDAAAIFSGGI